MALSALATLSWRCVAAFDDVDLAGKTIVSDLSGETVYFVRAHGHIHGGDLRHFGKGAQRMDEDRERRPARETAWAPLTMNGLPPSGYPDRRQEESQIPA